MFVKCPRCHSLVAIDAVTGAPPEYCPYCDSPIAGVEPDPVADEASNAAATLETSASEPSMAEAEAADMSPPDDIAGAGIHDADPEVDDVTSANIEPDEAAATALPVSPAGQSLASSPEESAAEDPSEPTQAPPQSADGIDIDAAALAEKPAAPKRRKRAAPSFVRRPAQAPRRPTPPWLWAIAGGLALLAGVQIVFADRAQLAADARWRPTLAAVCEVLHCKIPPWREPAAFAMIGRDVRQHPYMPGALRVDATFRNNARWPQPWPELVLTLSDVNGRALGTRTFSAKEYLDNKVTQKEIASGQSAAVRMDVMEPGAGVVSFSFDFR